MSSNLTTHQPNGKFAPGNQLARFNNHPSIHRIVELRTEFLTAVTPEKLHRIEQELFNLATLETDARVRLAAVVEYLNRIMGKPTETVNVNSTEGRPAPVLNISPEQASVLESIIGQNPPK